MPTQHGESAAVRLLPRDRGLLELSKLGLASHDEAVLKKLLALPHGMIVITGPTGSGKTTTLATMLSILNETSRKILTIEDPVEYEIPGINQSQVKPSIGLTFATALRAFVRQDPDVIMVGEVRDAETANIAIHAALTGHLVLTTLHTETAAAAVPRLLDLGVEGFLLKSTLRAVIAQRLVRILCDRCKTQRKLAADDLARDPRYGMVGFAAGDVVHEACGCERCGASGFRGRAGVFEVLEISGEVRNLIGSQTDANMLDQAAIKAGMTTMLDDAVAKCRAGVTTVPETLRGVFAQRLVRVLCDRCKRPRQLSSADVAADPRYSALGFKVGETLHEPGSCERCGGTGYRGRNGVFEIIELNEEIRSLIGTTANSSEIERAALRGGMTTMLDDAVAKCRAGVTSPAEALRVVALR
jgi:general secretion pathway protein E